MNWTARRGEVEEEKEEESRKEERNQHQWANRSQDGNYV